MTLCPCPYAADTSIATIETLIFYSSGLPVDDFIIRIFSDNDSGSPEINPTTELTLPAVGLATRGSALTVGIFVAGASGCKLGYLPMLVLGNGINGISGSRETFITSLNYRF